MTPNPYDYSRGGGRPARISKLTGTWSAELDDLLALKGGLLRSQRRLIESLDRTRRDRGSVSPSQAALIAKIWDAKCGEKKET